MRPHAPVTMASLPIPPSITAYGMAGCLIRQRASDRNYWRAAVSFVSVNAYGYRQHRHGKYRNAYGWGDATGGLLSLGPDGSPSTSFNSSGRRISVPPVIWRLECHAAGLVLLATTYRDSQSVMRSMGLPEFATAQGVSQVYRSLSRFRVHYRRWEFPDWHRRRHEKPKKRTTFCLALTGWHYTTKNKDRDYEETAHNEVGYSGHNHFRRSRCALSAIRMRVALLRAARPGA